LLSVSPCASQKAGLIEISANDEIANPPFECCDLISPELKDGKWWVTHNTALDHFVKIDFKSFRVCPLAHLVQAHNRTWGNNSFLKIWRFEGSNDGSGWVVLDSRTNSSELQGNDREASFEFSSISSASFRFLRFVMIGTNWSNTHQLSLQRLEVFGR
jgi:hypothetical protein